MLSRGILFLTVLWQCATVGLAYDWKQAAEEQELSPEQIQRLERDKIVFTDKHTMQVFSPYVDPDVPVFITSDSILNAYHVLFEESILRLEQTNYAKLPKILDHLWENLETADRNIEGNSELVSAAKARAKIVLGTAIALMTGKPPTTDDRIAAFIREEVDRVEAAEARVKPEWMGPPDEPPLAIDYSRYKPRGFYSRTDGLKRYFRAVSWLQSIPFEVDDNEQLLAIVMLGGCLSEKRPDEDKHRESRAAFFGCFKELLGDQDDWDLLTAATFVTPGLKLDLNGTGLDAIRKAIKAKAEETGHRPMVNDQVGYLPGEVPLSFRVISAHRLPDAVLFMRTTDPSLGRTLPSGLDVCVALGSDYAKSRLEGRSKEAVIDTIEQSKDIFTGSSLYFDYLDCVSTLLDPPSPDAPEFMSRDPWQAKSCQTVLGGWAQLRHTWALQAKDTTMFYCTTEAETPVGFVEPVPDFFARLEELSKRTAKLLQHADAEVDKSFSAIARLQSILATLEAARESKAGDDDFWGSFSDSLVCYSLEKVMRGSYGEMTSEEAKALVDESIPKLKGLMDRIERGETPAHPFVGYMSESAEKPLPELWEDLATLSARLRSIAQKHLDNEPLDGDDRYFIIKYGEHLAPLTFHLGTPTEVPRDDAPRIIDVFHNPMKGVYLEVGVGRPQIMYVLYSSEGEEYLCRGVVMPYHEFQSTKRLNDHEWKGMLAFFDPPAKSTQPPWLRETFGNDDDGLPSYVTVGGGIAVAAIALAFWLRSRRRRELRRQ